VAVSRQQKGFFNPKFSFFLNKQSVIKKNRLIGTWLSGRWAS
jgi:hypothetical protein